MRVWEYHKAVIWGELIALGTKLKRERQAEYIEYFLHFSRQNSRINLAGRNL